MAAPAAVTPRNTGRLADQKARASSAAANLPERGRALSRHGLEPEGSLISTMPTVATPMRSETALQSLTNGQNAIAAS
jgi:hypothetical protein